MRIAPSFDGSLKGSIMTAAGSRYRVVTFRISSEEYENMCAASRADGDRSVSDFARVAVADRVRLVNNRFSLEDHVKELAAKSESAEAAIRDISDRLQSLEQSVKRSERP